MHVRVLRWFMASSIAALAMTPGMAASQGAGVAAGRIVSDAGVPLEGVEILVVDVVLNVVTDVNGHFRIELPAGRHLLRARRIGFRPHTETIGVTAGETTHVAIRLATVAQALPTATVVGNREQIRLALVGFEERTRLGQAPPSHFINRASIDSVRPARLTEMFDRLTSRARSCKDADAVYIDGLLIPLKQDKAAFALKKRMLPGYYALDDHIPPSEVAGIEIYVGTQAPVEFAKTRLSGCSVVVWTR